MNTVRADMVNTYEEVRINGSIIGFYTTDRIDKNQFPPGAYCYSIRHDGGGDPATIENDVLVDHYGDLITLSPINYGNDKNYLCIDTVEYRGNYLKRIDKSLGFEICENINEEFFDDDTFWNLLSYLNILSVDLKYIRDN